VRSGGLLLAENGLTPSSGKVGYSTSYDLAPCCDFLKDQSGSRSGGGIDGGKAGGGPGGASLLTSGFDGG